MQLSLRRNIRIQNGFLQVFERHEDLTTFVVGEIFLFLLPMIFMLVYSVIVVIAGKITF